MTLFAGSDVSVRETSACVVDAAGKVLAERKIATEPDDLIELLRSISSEYGRIGLKPVRCRSGWSPRLAEAGLPIVCVETRQVTKALLTAQQINKSRSSNDARGIAQMMRVGLFKPRARQERVASQDTADAADQPQAAAEEAAWTSRRICVGRCVKNFGLKVGVRESSAASKPASGTLVEGFHRLAAIVEPMLTVRRVLRERQFAVLHLPRCCSASCATTAKCVGV